MQALTPAFLALTLIGAGLRLWLLHRQFRAVQAHREVVPGPFAATVSLEDHRRAADFTMAHARVTALDIAFSAVVLLALTLGGGIAAIDALWAGAGWPQPWQGVAVIGTVLVATAALDLPFSIWRTFRVEARFGFNRTTPALFLADLVKGLAVGALIGGPLLVAILLLMENAGRNWWLYVFVVWVAFSLTISWAWPAFIAPLFNRFVPLPDAELLAKVEALLARCGFKSQGVFVMDGSRRTAHGNAYFTGLGRNKRIVFFDTLMERLAHPEIEAVLAHELGHFRLHHVRQRLILSLITSFIALGLLGELAAWPGFYESLGVPEPSSHAALLLFMFAAPVLTFFVTPVGAWWSRKHEFEADRFAGRQTAPADLAAALVKLYRDNATTLTPDPVYASFYYSHPPALTRIEKLQQQGAAAS